MSRGGPTRGYSGGGLSSPASDADSGSSGSSSGGSGGGSSGGSSSTDRRRVRETVDVDVGRGGPTRGFSAGGIATPASDATATDTSWPGEDRGRIRDSVAVAETTSVESPRTTTGARGGQPAGDEVTAPAVDVRESVADTAVADRDSTEPAVDPDRSPDRIDRAAEAFRTRVSEPFGETVADATPAAQAADRGAPGRPGSDFFEGAGTAVAELGNVPGFVASGRDAFRAGSDTQQVQGGLGGVATVGVPDPEAQAELGSSVVDSASAAAAEAASQPARTAGTVTGAVLGGFGATGAASRAARGGRPTGSQFDIDDFVRDERAMAGGRRRSQDTDVEQETIAVERMADEDVTQQSRSLEETPGVTVEQPADRITTDQQLGRIIEDAAEDTTPGAGQTARQRAEERVPPAEEYPGGQQARQQEIEQLTQRFADETATTAEATTAEATTAAGLGAGTFGLGAEAEPFADAASSATTAPDFPAAFGVGAEAEPVADPVRDAAATAAPAVEGGATAAETGVDLDPFGGIATPGLGDTETTAEATSTGTTTGTATTMLLGAETTVGTTQGVGTTATDTMLTGATATDTGTTAATTLDQPATTTMDAPAPTAATTTTPPGRPPTRPPGFPPEPDADPDDPLAFDFDIDDDTFGTGILGGDEAFEQAFGGDGAGRL